MGALLLGFAPSCVSPQIPSLSPRHAEKPLPAVAYLMAESRQALRAGRRDSARASAERAYQMQGDSPEVLYLMAELAEGDQEPEDCLSFAHKAQDHLPQLDSALGTQIQKLLARCAKKVNR